MRKLLLILLLLLIIPGNIYATIPVTKGLETFKISKKLLIQAGHWKRIPTVVVCDYAPVGKKDVNKAIKWWNERGYMFYHSVYLGGKRALSVCQDSDPVGYITINLVTQETFKPGSNMATTHFYVDNDTGEVSWAKIYLKNKVRARVLEHELGHALGWMHTEEIGHLMNEKWIYGGWGDKGL